jgi:hypothetical protein
VHPDAIVFVELEMWTGTGLQSTKLSKPAIGNLVYAPHYYDPLFLYKIVSPLRYEPVAARNRALARNWDAAVMMAEFGSQAWALTPGYMDMIYSDLEAFGESSMQWSYTPEWTPATLDGWNVENLAPAWQRCHRIVLAQRPAQGPFSPDHQRDTFIGPLPMAGRFSIGSLHVRPGHTGIAHCALTWHPREVRAQ